MVGKQFSKYYIAPNVEEDHYYSTNECIPCYSHINYTTVQNKYGELYTDCDDGEVEIPCLKEIMFEEKQNITSEPENKPKAKVAKIKVASQKTAEES